MTAVVEPFLVQQILPATAWLSAVRRRQIGTRERHVMLLAIGLQESRLRYRRQKNGGPATSVYQFEGHQNQALDLLLRHRSLGPVARVACACRHVPFQLAAAHEAIANDDWLATIFASLLLDSDGKAALPAIGDEAGSWACYLRCWRPGKPHPETWVTRPEGPSLHAQARAAVESVQPSAAGAPTAMSTTQNDIAAAVAAALKAAAGTPPAAAPDQAAARSITVDTSGSTVSVDPMQFKGSFGHSSTYIAIALAVFSQLSPALVQYMDPAINAVAASGWAHNNGLLAAGLIFFGRYLRDAVSAYSAGKVAAAASAPPTFVPPPVAAPAPAAPAPSGLGDDQIAQLVAAINAGRGEPAA